MNNSLDSLKSKLVVAILLLYLIDIQSFGFQLDQNARFAQQNVKVDLERQSFLWVHQKLTGLLEPYELLANVDIDGRLNDTPLSIHSFDSSSTLASSNLQTHPPASPTVNSFIDRQQSLATVRPTFPAVASQGTWNQPAQQQPLATRQQLHLQQNTASG